MMGPCSPFSFFFNDTATTEIYTLSLHDALPICLGIAAQVVARTEHRAAPRRALVAQRIGGAVARIEQDRKSTRLNSSHQIISYAVFCLKKKNVRLGAEASQPRPSKSALRAENEV